MRAEIYCHAPTTEKLLMVLKALSKWQLQPEWQTVSKGMRCSGLRSWRSLERQPIVQECITMLNNGQCAARSSKQVKHMWSNCVTVWGDYSQRGCGPNLQQGVVGIRRRAIEEICPHTTMFPFFRHFPPRSLFKWCSRTCETTFLWQTRGKPVWDQRAPFMTSDIIYFSSLLCHTWMFPSILDSSGVPLPSRGTFNYPGSCWNANSDHEERPLFFFSHREMCIHSGCARPRRRCKVIITFQFGVLSALQLSANHLQNDRNVPTAQVYSLSAIRIPQHSPQNDTHWNCAISILSQSSDKYSLLNSPASDRYVWQLRHRKDYITPSPGFLRGNYS